MDRDNELENNYAEMKRESANKHGVVEGEWYLREKTWENRKESIIVNRLTDNGFFEGCGPGSTVEKMKEWGWKITRVVIYRLE